MSPLQDETAILRRGQGHALHPRPLIHQIQTEDGSGIMQNAQMAKPQAYRAAEGEGWLRS